MTIDYAGMFGGVVTEATTGLTETAPLGVKIMGIMLAITLAIAVIRKVAK